MISSFISYYFAIFQLMLTHRPVHICVIHAAGPSAFTGPHAPFQTGGVNQLSKIHWGWNTYIFYAVFLNYL